MIRRIEPDRPDGCAITGVWTPHPRMVHTSHAMLGLFGLRGRVGGRIGSQRRRGKSTASDTVLSEIAPLMAQPPDGGTRLAVMRPYLQSLPGPPPPAARPHNKCRSLPTPGLARSSRVGAIGRSPCQPPARRRVSVRASKGRPAGLEGRSSGVLRLLIVGFSAGRDGRASDAGQVREHHYVSGAGHRDGWLISPPGDASGLVRACQHGAPRGAL